MARKGKVGLDYFPHDTEFDNELEYIISLHKETGYTVYFRILERLYGIFGYYYPSNKKSLVLLSSKINIDINQINVIINDCLNEHLFDNSLHKKYSILTSRGIQKRFFDAVKRRQEIHLIKEYILLNNEDINSYNVNILWQNADKSTQSRVEESKGEKSRVEEIVYPFDDKVFFDAWNKWKQYKKEQFRFTYKSQLSEQAALKKLGDMAGGNLNYAVEIIFYSIGQTYRGLYEPKNPKTKSEISIDPNWAERMKREYGGQKNN